MVGTMGRGSSVYQFVARYLLHGNTGDSPMTRGTLDRNRSTKKKSQEFSREPTPVSNASLNPSVVHSQAGSVGTNVSSQTSQSRLRSWVFSPLRRAVQWMKGPWRQPHPEVAISPSASVDLTASFSDTTSAALVPPSSVFPLCRSQRRRPPARRRPAKPDDRRRRHTVAVPPSSSKDPSQKEDPVVMSPRPRRQSEPIPIPVPEPSPWLGEGGSGDPFRPDFGMMMPPPFVPQTAHPWMWPGTEPQRQFLPATTAPPYVRCVWPGFADHPEHQVQDLYRPHEALPQPVVTPMVDAYSSWASPTPWENQQEVPPGTPPSLPVHWMEDYRPQSPSASDNISFASLFSLVPSFLQS